MHMTFEQERVGQPLTPTYTMPLPPGDYIYAERSVLDPPKGPERYSIGDDDEEVDAPMEPASDSDDELVEKQNLGTRKLLTMDKKKRDYRQTGVLPHLLLRADDGVLQPVSFLRRAGLRVRA